jgi:N-acetylmuramic acid 6-phosphate (MurNAc-6-P) etherase
MRGAGKREVFKYLCAGGDSALVLSDELPEDDPQKGAQELKEIVNEFEVDNVLYLIGVTCGLSAPYVAGQLDYALKADSRISGAAVLGFNPLNLSRNKPIEKDLLARSFRGIIAELSENEKFTPLNPVIGPEPVAGSSRMKGGSATAIMLDTICLRAIGLAGIFDIPHILQEASKISILEQFGVYRFVHSLTYHSIADSLPIIMEKCASSLLSNGRVIFIGEGVAGCLGFIDASEMPDTYGSPFDQIRGFVEGGWASINNKEGDISKESSLLNLSLSGFEADVLPTLAQNDTVIFLVCPEGVTPKLSISDRMKQALKTISTKATLGILCTCSANDSCVLTDQLESHQALFSSVILPQRIGPLHEGLYAFSLKLMTNAITTYAQAVGRGALFKGLMVATSPANDKIYFRCVCLIADTAQVTPEVAEMALLKAIYRKDSIDKGILERARSDHIKASILPSGQRSNSQTTLPLALLIATRHWTVEQALAALREEPRVSILLEQQIEPPTELNYTIGIDLGGTKIRGGAVIDGEVSDYFVEMVDSTDRSFLSVVDLICKVYWRIVAEKGTKPSCMGIGTPGQVGTDGSIGDLVNYPSWKGSLPLKSLLEDRLDLQNIAVFDDADAAVAAEAKSYGKPFSTLCLVTIGTGIGTGVVLSSGLLPHKGSRGLIEGGHMVVNPNPPYARSCACGQVGW